MNQFLNFYVHNIPATIIGTSTFSVMLIEVLFIPSTFVMKTIRISAFVIFNLIGMMAEIYTDVGAFGTVFFFELFVILILYGVILCKDSLRYRLISMFCIELIAFWGAFGIMFQFVFHTQRKTA